MSTAKKLMHDNDGYFDGLNQNAQNIVKEAILKAASDRNGPEGYKQEDECLEPVECRSRDGFIPFGHNKGGLLYINFTDLMGYWGGGYTPSHAGAASEIERQIDFNLNAAQDYILVEYNDIFKMKNVSPNDVNYHALHETKDKELIKIAEELSESEHENLSDENSSIMHEFRFMYHGVNDKGVHEASVSAALNTEGPYHRSSISWAPNVFCEGSKEIEIKWKNNAELKRKLDKALKQVSKAIF